jgi:hypothetical protein
MPPNIRSRIKLRCNSTPEGFPEKYRGNIVPRIKLNGFRKFTVINMMMEMKFGISKVLPDL